MTMQMATSSAERKPIQTDRIGEVREDLPGSTLERGTHLLEPYGFFFLAFAHRT